MVGLVCLSLWLDCWDLCFGVGLLSFDLGWFWLVWFSFVGLVGMVGNFDWLDCRVGLFEFVVCLVSWIGGIGVGLVVVL